MLQLVEPPTKIQKMIECQSYELPAKITETHQKISNILEEEDEKYQYNSYSCDESVLYFKKLSANATTPMRGSMHAAGFDLFSAEELVIEPNSHKLVKTDIAVKLPKGSYGRVAPRSGLALKSFIDVGAGVVDYDYRGNLGVVLFNHGKNPFVVKCKDRIAQFIVEKIYTPKLIELEDLDETLRGSAGYGSTGTR
ncbi:deoxyuridine 5'-triphosphate nucleotidohydrolase isoform X2 [Hydra vulgaris]|uniref:Deoxyuridine 5'-triphosphate nucleotidohydrolase n=1 Tax=Hydra vulgaris TaxID=6087 RepID=A0ABM4BJR7_HYDVU